MGVFILLTLLHVLFFVSIFEIYFKSPLVENIPVSTNTSSIQLANRVVVFFADGVRAEKFYQLSRDNTSNSPYLRSLLGNNEACGGIAHTQVPTETRPGAIAMLAGFYEDPSAIFKGWQDNPVEFDHIFNQSEFSVAFGSPDVLKMFSKGFKKTKVDRFHFEFYDENEQQFKAENQLNYWVGNRSLQYLKNNKDSRRLKQNKVIFMLHFLGPDTAGHNYKPHSKEYADNILVVDQIVKTVADSIADFYNHDSRTSFIYASDHGMTDWGSHGDGSDHETQTPFIAWGAGVSCPSYPPSPHTGSFLPHSQGRLEIAQVDIVSLVATLLGVSIPVHSVGELPLQYLSLDKPQQAQVLRSNAIQIHNAFLTLQIQRRESIARFLFKPFRKLSESEEEKIWSKIDLVLEVKDFDFVISQYKRLMKLCLEGLSYYHTYYQRFLLSCISLAYLGLLRLLLTSAQSSIDVREWEFKVSGWVISVWAVLLFYCYNIGLPLTSYVFALLPTVTLFCVHIPDKGETSFHLDVKFIVSIGVYSCGILLFVFTFFFRWILSILVLSIVAFYFVIDQSKLRVYYNLSLVPLAVFPSLPIIGTQDSNKYFLILAATVWFTILLYKVYRNKHNSDSAFKMHFIILGVTVAHLLLWSTVEPYWFQFIISWLILVSSPISIYISSSLTEDRLVSIGAGLAPPFILLCSTYEVFFFLFLCVHLLCWYRVEIDDRDQGFHLHNAFLILFYLFLCFFGLGNIASVSSYDWNSVRYFLSVFSPFTMMTFCLGKIFIPFLCVTCVMRAIHVKTYTREQVWEERALRKGTERILQLVLAFCDMMGLVFLFLVRNTGSWKEIGLSISHVVIVHCITLALMCLYAVASSVVPFSYVKIKY